MNREQDVDDAVKQVLSRTEMKRFLLRYEINMMESPIICPALQQHYKYIIAIKEALRAKWGLRQ